jgi:hypothetical protein
LILELAAAAAAVPILGWLPKVMPPGIEVYFASEPVLAEALVEVGTVVAAAAETEVPVDAVATNGDAIDRATNADMTRSVVVIDTLRIDFMIFSS